MIFVLFSILVSSVISDKIMKNINLPQINIRFFSDNLYLYLLTLINVYSLLFTLINLRPVLFSHDKLLIMSNLGRFHILMQTSASIGLVVSFCKKKINYFIYFFFILLIIDVIFIGHRSAFALSIVSIMFIYLFNMGKQRLFLKNFKFMLFSSGFAIFMLINRTLLRAIAKGDWSFLGTFLRIDYVLKGLTTSEPFITQLILNKVLEEEFKVGFIHLKQILYQFILFSDKLGVNVTNFEALVQTNLITGVRGGAGIAENIWAEVWSVGGWEFLILFLIFFNSIIFIGNLLISVIENNAIKYTLCLNLSYFSFYIHRQGLFSHIGLQKRFLLVFLINSLLTMILFKVSEDPIISK